LAGAIAEFDITQPESTNQGRARKHEMCIIEVKDKGTLTGCKKGAPCYRSTIPPFHHRNVCHADGGMDRTGAVIHSWFTYRGSVTHAAVYMYIQYTDTKTISRLV
jgi:hypothetical protein